MLYTYKIKTTCIIIMNNYVASLLLLFCMLNDADCMGISNVHFPYTNNIKGKSPNAKLNLKGVHELDVTDNLWPSLIRNADPPFKLNRMPHLKLFLCTGNTLDMIGQMNENMNSIVKKNIKTILKGINKAKEIQLDHFVITDPFLDLYNFSNPDYGCYKIPKSDMKELNDSYHHFNIEVTVTKFGSILFVDNLGVTAFHYTELMPHKKKDSTVSKIKYCEGNSYSGYLHKLAPRPICPDTVESQKQKIERGKIIIYKPSIMTYMHEVTKCIITNIFVYSYKNWGTSSEDNKVSHPKPFNPNLNACKNDKEFVKYYPLQSLSDDVIPLVADENHKLKCGPHHKVCQKWRQNHAVVNPKFFDPKMTNNGTFEKGDVERTFKYGRDPKYEYWWYTRQHEHFHKAIMMKSEMNIGVNKEGMTAWGRIPSEVLKTNCEEKGVCYYYFQDGVVIWDPIPKSELCEYVPRFTSEVVSIRYDHNEIDDIMDDDIYLTYFVSEQEKSMIAVNNEMTFAFNKTNPLPGCIPFFDYDDKSMKAYKLNNDEILIWQPYDEKSSNGSKFTKTKYHSMLNHRKIDIKTTASGQNKVARTQYSRYKSDNVTTTTPPHKVLEVENEQFTKFKDKRKQVKNQHIRVLQNCKQDQATYDNFKKILDLDPSRSLSEKLNRPVLASHGGSNYYNVRECEFIIVYQVLKSLRTNDPTYRVPLNVNRNPWRDSVDLEKIGMDVPDDYVTMPQLIKNRGNVQPSTGKCLAYPLVIFSLVEEFETKQLGQISRDGTVRTSNFYYLEQCDWQRKQAFDINGKVYYFEMYTLKDAFGTHERRDDIVKIVDFTKPSDTVEEEFIEYHIPTSVIAKNLYSRKETQSAINGMPDVIYTVSQGAMAQIEYEQNPQYKGSVSGGGGFTFDLKAVGSVFRDVTGGLGEMFGEVCGGLGTVITAEGSAIEHEFNGAGKFVKQSLEGGGTFVKSVGSVLGDVLIFVIVGIISLIVLVIIGYVVYKKVFLISDDAFNDDDIDDEMKKVL